MYMYIYIYTCIYKNVGTHTCFLMIMTFLHMIFDFDIKDIFHSLALESYYLLWHELPEQFRGTRRTMSCSWCFGERHLNYCSICGNWQSS